MPVILCHSQARENICRLPALKGHTYGTDFEVRGTNRKRAGLIWGAGCSRPHALFACRTHRGTWHGVGRSRFSFPMPKNGKGQSHGRSRGIGTIELMTKLHFGMIELMTKLRFQHGLKGIRPASLLAARVRTRRPAGGCWQELPIDKPGGGQCAGLSLSIFLRFWSV